MKPGESLEDFTMSVTYDRRTDPDTLQPYRFSETRILEAELTSESGESRTLSRTIERDYAFDWRSGE